MKSVQIFKNWLILWHQLEVMANNYDDIGKEASWFHDHGQTVLLASQLKKQYTCYVAQSFLTSSFLSCNHWIIYFGVTLSRGFMLTCQTWFQIWNKICKVIHKLPTDLFRKVIEKFIWMGDVCWAAQCDHLFDITYLFNVNPRIACSSLGRLGYIVIVCTIHDKTSNSNLPTYRVPRLSN